MHIDFFTSLTNPIKEQTDLIKTAVSIALGQLMIIAATLLALTITYFGWASSPLAWLVYAVCLAWFGCGVALTIIPFSPKQQ